MGIYRGTGGTGDSTTDATVTEVTQQATNAAQSASDAASSASSASSSASTATTKASEASISAFNAAGQATLAGNAKDAAVVAQGAAEDAQTAAETAQQAAEDALDSLDDKYLGSKTTDPTVDNDGDALVDGALYYNTTDNVLKVYDLGTTSWLLTKPTSAQQTNIDTVAGDSTDIQSLADISSDITTVSGISSDVTSVAADATDIGTVAGISANVTTVAGISSDVTTVAADGTDIGTVAGISSDVSTVSGISSDVTTVAGISGDVTTVAGDTAEIGTVAGISANVTTVAGNNTNVTTVAGISSDVTTVAGISSDVSTVAADGADIGTVAGISSDVTTVSGVSTDIATLADIEDGTTATGAIQSAASNATDITTVAGSISNVNTVAARDTDIGTVAARDANIGTVAARDTDIGTVAARDTDIGTVAARDSDIDTVATISSDVTTVSGISGNVTTVAGINTDVTTVAGISSDVTSVADNLSGVTSFAAVYRVGTTDPTTSLDEGDLFFNTTDNALKYYNGTSWASITAGLTDIVGDSSPQLGGNLDAQSTYKITNLVDPANAQDATTKAYVDSLIAAGIHYHTPVRVERPDTDGNLSATYDNGTDGVGATLTGAQEVLVIDGVTLELDDRVLIYNQTDATENGIYYLSTVGVDSTTAWVLTRATDADSYGLGNQSLSEGTSVFVTEGDDGAGEVYTCNTTGTITFGTTDIEFTQIGKSAVITGGTGITIDSNVVSANVSATAQTTTAETVSSTENRTYAVQVDSSDNLVVNVPWSDTDTNTTYSEATSSTLGLVKIGYGENGKNYPVELSSGQMFVNVPWTDSNTTYSAGTGLSLSGTTFSVSDNYVLNSSSDTLTGGTYTFNSSTDQKIILAGSSSPYIRFRESATDKAYIQWNSAGYFQIHNTEDNSRLRIKDDLDFTPDSSNYYSIWHAGNDGSGSGLDADTLDGVQASSFLRSDATDYITGYTRWYDGYGARFGNSDDLTIYHNGSNSYIDNDTGHIYIRNNVDNDDGGNIYIQAKSGEHGIIVNDDSYVQLYHNGTEYLRTISGGVDISGDLYIDDQIIHNGDTNTYMQFHASDQWRVVTGGSERLEVNNSFVTISSAGFRAGTYGPTNNSGNFTPDFHNYNIFMINMTGNITLVNTTNGQGGQTGLFLLYHSGGARTVSLGSYYDTVGGAGLTLSSTSGVYDVVPYVILADGYIKLGNPILGINA